MRNVCNVNMDETMHKPSVAVKRRDRRGGRTVDEISMRRFQLQHPIYIPPP